MFDAGNARVSFYSQETGNSYEIECYRRMSLADCEKVRSLAYVGVLPQHVHAAVSCFQALHNTFDYERDLVDVKRGGTMLKLFERLRSVGISAYVDGLSWG